jgi:hypothetical protein
MLARFSILGSILIFAKVSAILVHTVFILLYVISLAGFVPFLLLYECLIIFESSDLKLFNLSTLFFFLNHFIIDLKYFN